MTQILKNKAIELHVDHPLENYNAPRFDWTGKIKLLKYNGLVLSGNEKTNSIDHNLYGRGFYNEFGINEPVGFSNIKIGDWFHKIGVGALQKEHQNYFFLNNYKTKPVQFIVEHDERHVFTTCIGEDLNNYAYILKKEIVLKDYGFKVLYKLKNTGKKPIKTTEYNHNFIEINNNLIGKDYTLKFDFNINPEKFDEFVNPNRSIIVKDKMVTFNQQPKTDFFISNLTGGQLVDATWTIEDRKNKIAISEKASFKTSSINLWGCGHVISPELFIKINLQPGNSVSWSRDYSIFELE